jgi:hypothetical protein
MMGQAQHSTFHMQMATYKFIPVTMMISGLELSMRPKKMRNISVATYRGYLEGRLTAWTS